MPNESDAEDPSPLAVAPREVEREWGEHHEGRAEGDRMFGRAEDPALAGTDAEELRPADLTAVEDRNHPGQVVEDVESGSCLDDCEERDDGPADDKCLGE